MTTTTRSAIVRDIAERLMTAEQQGYNIDDVAREAAEVAKRQGREAAAARIYGGTRPPFSY